MVLQALADARRVEPAAQQQRRRLDRAGAHDEAVGFVLDAVRRHGPHDAPAFERERHDRRLGDDHQVGAQQGRPQVDVGDRDPFAVVAHERRRAGAGVGVEHGRAEHAEPLGLLDREQMADREQLGIGRRQAAADQRRAAQPEPLRVRLGRAALAADHRRSRGTAAPARRGTHHRGRAPAPGRDRGRPRAARPRCWSSSDRREATTQPAVPPPITSQRTLTSGDLAEPTEDAWRLEREAGEVGGVVVAHQPPAAAARRDELGQRRVRRLQFEHAVGRQPQQRPERGVDDATVACHHDRTSAVLVHDARQRGADTVVELGDRLAARERHGVRVGLPVGHPVALDEVAEREPVAVGAGVVLAESRLLDDRQAQHRSDDLGGLDRPRVARWRTARSP